MKRLIVNADDFGFTRDVNQGIVEAHSGGILTACTLMANGDAFQHAVDLARATPSLDVGCHLVFVQGMSVLDPSRPLPSSLGGVLRKQPFYEEAAAQVRKIITAGIRPTHLDTHKHTHLLFAPVLDAVARVAREFDIPWVRWPFDFKPRTVASFAMRLRRGRFSEVLKGLRKTDHFAGFETTGTLNQVSLSATLLALPDGLTELMCHPARLGAELRNAATRLKETREVELNALTSSSIRSLIQSEGIQLVNYALEP
ncbi:MAG: ChbG/HpnK family deacetylase [Terriglobia bacterium]